MVRCRTEGWTPRDRYMCDLSSERCRPGARACRASTVGGTMSSMCGRGCTGSSEPSSPRVPGLTPKPRTPLGMARVPSSHWLDASRTKGDTWDRGKQIPILQRLHEPRASQRCSGALSCAGSQRAGSSAIRFSNAAYSSGVSSPILPCAALPVVGNDRLLGTFIRIKVFLYT